MSLASVQAYLMLEQDTLHAAILRRATGWSEEVVEGPGGVLALPELGVELPLGEQCAG
jgi:hypothetical protein